MKISRIRSQILVMPQQDPLANTPEDASAARPIVIVRLNTDDGIEGLGVTFYGGAITASLKRAIDDLGALVIGEDPLRVEAIVAKLRRAADSHDDTRRAVAIFFLEKLPQARLVGFAPETAEVEALAVERDMRSWRRADLRL